MKLEDINKKNIYKVPDNYFEQLPTRIQTRVNNEEKAFRFSLSWRFALRVATPAFALILLLFYFGIRTSDTAQSPEALLAMVETEDIIAYLENTDITTDDIINEIDFSSIDLTFEDEEIIMQDIDIDQDEMNLLFDEYGIDSEIL